MKNTPKEDANLAIFLSDFLLALAVFGRLLLKEGARAAAGKQHGLRRSQGI